MFLYVVAILWYWFMDGKRLNNQALENTPGTYVLIEDGVPKSLYTYTLNQDGTVNYKSAFDAKEGVWEVEKIPFFWPFDLKPKLIITLGPDKYEDVEYYGRDKFMLYNKGKGEWSDWERQ